ncbi:hypothetical protein HHI36_019776, partial [Cryptolaemus montrouzieri]
FRTVLKGVTISTFLTFVSSADSRSVVASAITCKVFPNPIQCANIHPDPSFVFAISKDSKQASHMNRIPLA